jgi:hypothetical protein
VHLRLRQHCGGGCGISTSLLTAYACVVVPIYHDTSGSCDRRLRGTACDWMQYACVRAFVRVLCCAMLCCAVL